MYSKIFILYVYTAGACLSAFKYDSTSIPEWHGVMLFFKVQGGHNS